MGFSPGCLTRAWGLICRGRFAPIWPALLHVVVAGVEAARGLTFGVSPERRVWDYFWQAVPQQDLLKCPWQSLWHLHAQPPGFSLWGLAWLRLLGRDLFPDLIQVAYVLMGTAVVAMSWRLTRALTRSPTCAAVAGLLMALNPALLYFEAYLLYEMLVIFLVVGSVWCLWRARLARFWVWLAVFAGVLMALALTRSLYHLLFLVGALVLAWPAWRAAGRRAKRPWLGVALIILALALPTLWYAKNAAQYGFFGSSSWFGLGLFKCVHKGFSYEEILDFADQGVIPEYVQARYPFQHHPVEYEPFGFDRRSDVPLLSRDDFHNVNVPEISKAYAGASLAMIRRAPGRYLGAIHDSYAIFCQPPSRFEHLIPQRIGHVFWEPVYAHVFHGFFLAEWVEYFFRLKFGSILYFIFPLLMIGGAVAWWRDRRRLSRPIEGAQPDNGQAREEEAARLLTLVYMLYVCLYVAVVCCLFEQGENMRFRFATEPLTLALGLMLLQRWWRRWGRSWSGRLRPGPASSRKSPDR